MNSVEAVRRMQATSGISGLELSRKLGRSPSYVSSTTSRGSDLRCSTLAEIAAALGYRIDLVEVETGERVGSIDPPRG